MLSILARFRTRAISQTTSDSSQSAPITPTNLMTPPPTLPAIMTSPFQRKIYPEVNTLLEELSAEHSPSPLRRVRSSSLTRHSLDEPTMNALAPHRVPPVAATSREGAEEDRSRPSTDSTTGGASRRFLSRISSLAASGEWSTFGRGRDLRSPALSDLRGRVTGANKSGSLRSSTTRNRSSRPSTGATQSTRSSQKQADMNKENAFEPLPPLPPRIGRPRANTSPTAPGSSAQISTPVARQLGFDSPRTFGYPTPEIDTNSPPLQTTPEDSPDFNATRPDNVARDMRGKTFPLRAGDMPSPSDTEMSPELTFGHGIRGYRSLPRVQQIFGPSARPNEPELPNLRSRSISAGRHGRRVSADLFAQQAADMTAGSSTETDWPGRVSRQMVLMSLEGRGVAHIRGGDGRGRAGSAPQSARSGENKAARGRNVPDRTGPELSESSTSPSHPTIPPLSPSVFASLGSPADIQDDVVSSTSSSVAAARQSSRSNLSGSRHGHNLLESFRSWSREDPKGMHAVEGDGTGPVARDRKPLRSSMKKKGPTTPRKADHPIASSSKAATSSSPSLLPSFSISAPSPTDFASPHFSSPSASLDFQSTLATPVRSETSKGKRKAEEVDLTPPDHKTAQKATFAIPESHTHRVSNASRAPSSYHRKRARLSSPLPSLQQSRPGSAGQASTSANAQNTGTHSSRASSRAPRGSSAPPAADNGSERRRSLSQVSIPISALVTPHAPSVGRSSTFHMRDPRRPQKKLETGWALRFQSEDETGSPRQAWMFYMAFVLFPLWWVASLLPTPQTREVGGTDTEKAVTLDDPQIEFDAKSWRTRCRIMAVISLFTYIPFIVCVAIFAGR